MTLTLSPETEADLQMIAHQRGFSAEEALQQLVAEARAAVEAELADAVAGLRQGDAEIAAGDWVALEDFRQGLSEQAQKRRQSNRLATAEISHV